MPAPTVGGRLAQVRVAAGYTQQQMAGVVGRKLRTVKAYEADEIAAPAMVLGVWARECGADVGEVLFGAPAA